MTGGLSSTTCLGRSAGDLPIRTVCGADVVPNIAGLPVVAMKIQSVSPSPVTSGRHRNYEVSGVI